MQTYYTKEELISYIEGFTGDIKIFVTRNGFIKDFEIKYVNNKDTEYEGQIHLEVES